MVFSSIQFIVVLPVNSSMDLMENVIHLWHVTQ